MPETYMILAHHSEANLRDLLSYIYCKDNLYIIHIDKKAKNEMHNFADCFSRQYNNCIVLESVYCSWGGYSLVEATRRGIVESLKNEIKWGHFILLSEYHVPLLSVRGIHEILIPNVSEIEMCKATDMHPVAQADLVSRLNLVYRELPGVGCFGTDLQNDNLNRIYHGSQWVILSRSFCNTMFKHEFISIWEQFSKSILPDEMIFQSIAAIAKEMYGEIISNSNRTFVATPEIADNNDLVFSESNFFDAVNDDRFIFIRK